MPRFEVFIPAADENGFNVTFRVDADNWMAALKTGMTKLGEQGANVRNILVDIQDDNSVHVTESASGRVFRIRELTDSEAAQAQVKKGAAPSRATMPAAPPAPEPAQAPKPLPEHKTLVGLPSFAEPPPAPPAPPSDAARETLPGRPPDLEVTPEPPPAPAPTRTSSGISSARRKSLHAEPQQVVELEAPTKPIVGQIGRSRSRTQKEEIEDMLAEVFERVQGVFAQPSVDDALYYLLDLALEKIPAESGTIFDADAATGDLTFHAVRGPKAKELLGANLVIPAGTGIVGFCAVEGVSVALSDVQKDPRYFRGVAERVNYTPQSILCAPMMTHGRTFGCLQILNRHNGSKFNEVEIGLASYIAHQAALYLNSR